MRIPCYFALPAPVFLLGAFDTLVYGRHTPYKNSIDTLDRFIRIVDFNSRYFDERVDLQRDAESGTCRRYDRCLTLFFMERLIEHCYKRRSKLYENIVKKVSEVFNSNECKLLHK